MACYVNSQPDIGGGGLQMELITEVTKDQEYTMQDKWIAELWNYKLILAVTYEAIQLDTYVYGSYSAWYTPDALTTLLRMGRGSSYEGIIASQTRGNSSAYIRVNQSKFSASLGHSFLLIIYGIK